MHTCKVSVRDLVEFILRSGASFHGYCKRKVIIAHRGCVF